MNDQMYFPKSMSQKILTYADSLGELNDVDTILDRVLFYSRQLTNAEAGSIFLLKHGMLEFRYVQNDKLYEENLPHEDLYANVCLPIDENSIVGYVAKTGETVVIRDAYDLDDNVPYRFNGEYDMRTGYCTKSMITIPLKSVHGNLVGVMQIINAKRDDLHIVPFDPEAQALLTLMAGRAAAAIERGLMTRELILRMMKMAQMRDPEETGAHVTRVGAYSAEIYRRWAHNRLQHGDAFGNGWDDLNTDEIENRIRTSADMLRLAAMLHDVGKVGISDTILKKPSRLDPEEYNSMKWHTIYGARLFSNSTSKLDQMCQDIALGHHEKWNGTGYPGNQIDLTHPMVQSNAPRKERDISIEARIVALADVYDALCSPRAYKDPWPENKVVDELQMQIGKHFDPELVSSFLQIHDVILAIRTKYAMEDIRESQIYN